jgi:hypothetical protein
MIFSGPTLPTKCSLLIGHSVDAADIAHYFVGILDEVNSPIARMSTQKIEFMPRGLCVFLHLRPLFRFQYLAQNIRNIV